MMVEKRRTGYTPISIQKGCLAPGPQRQFAIRKSARLEKRS